MKLRTLQNRVVVERLDAKAKFAGGIIILDSTQETPSQDEAFAVGPGVRALRLVIQGTIFVPISLPEVSPVTENPSELAKLPSLTIEGRGSSLTSRQRQVLQLLVGGKSNREIARNLKLGEGTVKIHMTALFRNLGVANRAAAAVVGARSKAVNFH
jgi:DNA-binding NarL/FixJ family response regulator